VTLVQPQTAWGYYGGDLQAKALLLMIYSALAPDSQIALALADDLLASSRKGYWINTSNTGWILQAFAEVIEAGDERSTELTARVALGDERLVETGFSGFSRVPFRVQIEPDRLRAAADAARAAAETAPGAASGASSGGGPVPLPLLVSREGRGRLYYALTLSYALAAEGVEAREEGIGIVTEILDRRGAPAGDTLRLGEVYRLHGVVYSTRDRDFLALRVPLPAGAEALDGSLAVTQRFAPADDGRREEPWYERPVQRVYDNEVRLFYDTFARGKREFSFLFRATTPGTFVVPPASAELMYEGEVFGRTAGREVRIAP
jgi:uncharacterized protein YfaS (alpha-2-macroglobulin family)